MVSFPNPRSRHPFHMYDMIRDQPRFLAETLARMGRSEPGDFLGKARSFIVTGCGTSFHAATYGARILQESMGSAAIVQPVHAYDIAYGGVPLPPRSTVLGVSHSGSTSTTNLALRRARRAGHRTLGLCGLPNSDMEDEVSAALVIGSTHDHSWANTMSYTTQLAAFAALAGHAGGSAWSNVHRALRGLPLSVKQALTSERRVRALAKRTAARDRVTFVGSGLDEITAAEAALKIRETCSLPASGYHMEQLLHGPFLSIDRREAVVMLRSREDGGRSEQIRQSLVRSGASVTTVGEGPVVDIRLPTVHRIVRPAVSIVPMQYLAYYAALARDANPDIMRTDIPRYRAALEPLFH